MIGTLKMDEIPLLDKNINSYSGITTDYNYIYIVSNKENVIGVYDFNLSCIKYITISNSYNDICYDNIEKCFWAVSNNSKIYKLDFRTFCEIDSIVISGCSKLSNIAFDNKNNTFIVSLNNVKIAIYNKNGQLISEKSLGHSEYIYGLTNICDINLISSSLLSSNTYLIKILDDKLIDENISCLPKNYITKSLCSFVCNDENYIFVLAQKQYKYMYIIKYKLIYKL